MVLMIDNYDSFTYNLVQYLNELGEEVCVFRNDKISIDEIVKLNPAHIVISPGPCTPDDAGVSLSVIMHLAGRIPILGVCLGHQAIGQAFGGRVVRAARPYHGKASPIIHDGQGIFRGFPVPFWATRYHSLIVERSSLPGCLKVCAWNGEGEIMGLKHREFDVYGVQFHPESILTEHGKELLQNFLALRPREPELRGN